VGLAGWVLGAEGGAGCRLESHCGGQPCLRGAAERLGPFQGGFSSKPTPWCRLLPDCRHVLWHLLGFWMLAPQCAPSSPMVPPTHAHTCACLFKKSALCIHFGSKAECKLPPIARRHCPHRGAGHREHVARPAVLLHRQVLARVPRLQGPRHQAW